MKNLIYFIVKLICGFFALVFGCAAMVVIFILASPLALCNKVKLIFKRVARCEACHSNKFNSKGIKMPQIPKDRIGCSV